jgi:hypothetical protein
MADEQMSDREVQEIRELHRELTERRKTAALTAVDICEIWRKIKPRWPIILKWVRRIPVAGDLIADILELLGEGLDIYCGSQG